MNFSRLATTILHFDLERGNFNFGLIIITFNMKNSIIAFLFLALLALVSCEEKGYPKPENLLSEKEMVDVLYDIHLAEAVASRNTFRSTDSLRVSSEQMYQAVLDRYGLQDSTFAQTLIYYSARPKVYEKIYKNVVDKLNREIDDMKQKKEMSVKKLIDPNSKE